MRKDNFQTRLAYRWKAHNKYGHSIHSPFVFDFTQQILKKYKAFPLSVADTHPSVPKKYNRLLHTIISYYKGYRFYINARNNRLIRTLQKRHYKHIGSEDENTNADKTIFILFQEEDTLKVHNIHLKIDCYFFALYIRNSDIKYYQEYYFWI